MVSSTTTKAEAQAPPTANPPMRNPWRQWREYAIASPIVTALVIALVSIGVVGFQSLKGDIRNTEARLREEIQASEARQREDIRALSDKLDRVLESLLAARS